MRHRAPALSLSLAFCVATGLALRAQTPPPAPAATQAKSEGKPADPIVDRIRDEGQKRSQVMKTVRYLTDVIGPRLTASPNMKRANNWTRDRLAEWGLENAHLESWGPFGRGWTLKRFSAQVVDPQCIPLIAYPKAWSPGTGGLLVAEVVHLNAAVESDLEKYRGKLRGKIVLNGPTRPVKAHFEPEGARASDRELLNLADAPEPEPRGHRRPRRRADGPMSFARRMAFARKKIQFLTDEGAALIADPSYNGDGGTLFVAQASVPSPAGGPANRPRPSAWDRTPPAVPPQVVLAIEHYNRLAHLLDSGETVKVAVDLQVEFHADDLMGYNTVAEIPGTDRKNEVVMLGGHMDSWHSGTGATDNAAGVAVAMEAVRILKATGLRPRRTVRIALWSGEEQGLLGSKAYVKEHFGDFADDPVAAAIDLIWGGETPRTLLAKPSYETFCAYFNLDNGTGKIRGVHMEGNEAVRPIFRRWLVPFRDLGAATLTITPTGGTDHMSFDAIGLPGFQFIQDPIEYEARTHHSNQDVYDRLQADDLKQAAVILASFVYHAASADEKLPRKPLPGPVSTATSPPAVAGGGGR